MSWRRRRVQITRLVPQNLLQRRHVEGGAQQRGVRRLEVHDARRNGTGNVQNSKPLRFRRCPQHSDLRFGGVEDEPDFRDVLHHQVQRLQGLGRRILQCRVIQVPNVELNVQGFDERLDDEGEKGFAEGIPLEDAAVALNVGIAEIELGR